MKRQYWSLSTLSLSFVLALVASCSQCSGVPSKVDYIQTLDKRCEVLETKAKNKAPEFKELAAKDLKAFVREFEKFVAEYNQEDAALQSLKRPREDNDILQEFWAEDMKLYSPLMSFSEQLKDLAHLVETLHSLTKNGESEKAKGLVSEIESAQKEMSKLESQMNANLKRASELAQKYGFRKCGYVETGFSGQLR